MTGGRAEPYRLYVLARRDLRGPDGGRVTSVLAQPSRLCLLTYLALAGRPVARSTITALFWPAADEVRARNNLNQAIHRLRRSMSKAVIESVEGDRVLVPDGVVWCDARALAEGRPVGVEPHELVGRDLLEGWNADDSQPLQEWLDGVRREMRARADELAEQSGIRERADEPAPEPDRRTRRRPWLWGLTTTTAAAALVLLALTRPGPFAAPVSEVAVSVAGAARPEIVFLHPELVDLADAPDALAELIRFEVLSRLHALGGAVHVSATAFEGSVQEYRIRMEAIGEPTTGKWFLKIITLVHPEGIRMQAILDGGGETHVPQLDTTFVGDHDLLMEAPGRIADSIVRAVAVDVLGRTATEPDR